ncbi:MULTISPECIES: ABC transporter substrate-binding protein [Tepidanaerobacter]|uniref:ABC transporter substrate-binding protein n=1 Tax=Tepidanaerobacter TaxID=499228 RepID=UPI000A4E3E6A|nr:MULTISPECIES: ABC transporter substrate-binding protein [Tepidanaerobacter]
MPLIKKISVIILTIIMIMGLTGCGNESLSSDKIILGYIGPMTGESALWGEVESNTLKMLVEETNNQGGILGKEVVLKIYDNRGDPVETTNAARRALQNDGVIAFIGPNTSSCAIALDEVCEEYKVPHITTCGTNYKVTQREDGSVRKYSFRVCLSDPQLGDIMGQYAYEKLGIEKVAIIYEITSEYSLGITQNFTDAFEKVGGKVTIQEGYKTGDVDFRPQLSKIKAVGDFDALMIPANYKEVGLIANQARALGITQRFLGVDAWMMEDLFEIAKDAVQETYFPCAMDVNAENLKEFKGKFKEKFKMDPDKGGTNAYLAYDCFQIVKNAIEKAGEPDPQKIRDAMENTKNLQCLTSVISIVPETHNPIRTASIFKIEGNNFVKVEEYAPDYSK